MTEDDRRLLVFEDAHPRHDGRKEELISTEFGIRPPRYYQRLHLVIKDPEAIAEFPMLINRTRRRLADQARRRASRAFDAR